MTYNLITILGPTAVGKTRLGALLAKRFNGEIISVDSRQVYRGMDIGTGKDIDDYMVDGMQVPYHLIDIIDADDEFNLFLFKDYFLKAYKQIIENSRMPFLVGGTGLYLHSVLKDYQLIKVDFDNREYQELSKLEIPELQQKLKQINPELHNTTDLLIKERIIKAIIIAKSGNKSEADNTFEINSLNIGVNADRENVKKNIEMRLRHRLKNGMIDEVKKLVSNGVTYDKLEFFGLEYKFIAKYLKGELDYDQMYEKLNIAIRQFAKRQMTWYRKMEKEGIKIFWIDGADFESAQKIITENIPTLN